MRIFPLICLFLLQPHLYSARILTDGHPPDKRIDSIVEKAALPFIRDSKHVGLSLGILKDGKRYFYNYGSLEKGKQIPPTERSIYDIASLTKSFTGLLLARAVTENKIRLKEDIRKYLEGEFPNLEYRGKPVTIESLANHTSGLPKNLPPVPEGMGPENILALSGKYTRENILKELANFKLDTFPGTRFSYSNAGVQLIGLILEKAYNMSYGDLVRKYITGPNNMTDTKIFPGAKDLQRTVKEYDGQGNLMPAFNFWPELPAAGILKSTTSDLLNYAAFNMDEGNTWVKLAHQPTFRHTEEDNSDIALCWFTKDQAGKGPEEGRKIMHAGGSFGSTSFCLLFPDQHTGIICLANDAASSTETELRQMAGSICREILSLPGGQLPEHRSR